ncbi:mitochondrial outer membrane protein porin of 36 kDa isoform X1 [Cryptomeria japonica]|uniref:mitochondrial outer membrane protein porin of 36 kDa isoform X1 n=2 Tax=Cryptomeria japonica TaxID=3369 RepID=UPI0025ACB8DE|nr:mitochondrial outer membrane protein porin of 36 kDa isoform X1 [Cryptomeria japonica]XP_057842382.1 mitochondrial outer membrane protein porin of 36 kDa isoform X1 [Cryptomeria japonica]
MVISFSAVSQEGQPTIFTEMGKGPGLFSDIGKKAKDLLTKDYNYDHKFTVTTYSETGLAFTSTGLKKGESFLGDLKTEYKYQNATVDVKVDTNSTISTNITLDQFVPHAKTVFSFKIPDQKSGKVDLQYLHDNVGLSSSIGLTPTPIAEFSAALGTGEYSLGGELAFDTASGAFTKYSAGVGVSKPEFSAAVILTDKGDTVKASYIHLVNPVTKTTVAAEITHKISKNENTFTVGSSHFVDHLTTMKTRVNNQGKLGALLQHEWRPKSLITISGEVDTKALDKNAKIGLALALKP